MSTCQVCGSVSEIIDDGREVETHHLGCESRFEPMVQTVEQCEFDECDNPKHSDHPRVKYCADHKDPKNRKE